MKIGPAARLSWAGMLRPCSEVPTTIEPRIPWEYQSPSDDAPDWVSQETGPRPSAGRSPYATHPCRALLRQGRSSGGTLVFSKPARFAFDCESPRHQVLLEPLHIANRLRAARMIGRHRRPRSETGIFWVTSHSRAAATIPKTKRTPAAADVHWVARSARCHLARSASSFFRLSISAFIPRQP